MLKFKVTEVLKPNSEILEIIKAKDYVYKTKNGKVKVLLNSNLQLVLPTVYIILCPATTITILEYKVDEISGKPFYIKEHDQKYNLKEIKQILTNLSKN